MTKRLSKNSILFCPVCKKHYSYYQIKYNKITNGKGICYKKIRSNRMKKLLLLPAIIILILLAYVLGEKIDEILTKIKVSKKYS